MNTEEKSKHLGVSLLAMVALAAASLWVLAYLASGRYGHPISESTHALSSEESGSSQGILRAGTGRAVRAAIDALRHGQRAEALMALDAARRVARVGGNLGGPRFAHLADEINRTKKAIQNGNFDQAPTMLDDALAAFDAPMADALRENPGGTPGLPDGSMQKYREATVVNAEGVRLGEIERVEGATTFIVVGSKHDLFGFVHAGGRRIRVQTDQLLWGKVHALGATLVALPTVSISADELEKRFSQIMALEPTDS